MGKNYTIYFHDDVVVNIEGLEGKGTLINQLVKDHFSNDEEILYRKIEETERTLSHLRTKYEGVREGKRQVREKEMQFKEVTIQMKEVGYLKTQLQRMWKDDEITDDDYWSCFDSGGLIIIERTKEVIEKVQTQNISS